MKKIYPYFSQNPLDRLDFVRRDEKKVEELKNSSESLYLLFDGSDIIFDEQNKNCFFSNKDLDTTQAVLLGRDKNRDYFALHVKNNKPRHLSKRSIRDLVDNNLLKEEKLGIIAQGAAVLNWHQSHQFCSACGKETTMKQAGWKRDCLTCKKEHFPRTDPVVMMLVTHGDYCLLGRGVNFPENRYSCLAGFMESGESIEDAARRELYEEAGVIGEDVEYMMCQPWPFPNTLMIGVHVKAKSKELKIDPHEIADAKWVHKDDIKAILNGDESLGMSTPSKIAIARNLLESWVG
jgi:NAD+ diphosphatase